MKQRFFFIALATTCALASVVAGAASPQKGTTYKWVDRNGITHYGDTVPPEYASQARAELNRQGVPVREYPRQLSPAEAEEAQKVAAEAARRRQHDSFLLTTYTRVSDIEQLRDERLALIDGQMDIARGSLAAANQRLGELQKRLGGFKPYSERPTAPRVPDIMVEEVVRALSDRRSMQETLDSREAEKTELRANFDSDIARYRELTTRPVAR